MRMTKPFLLSGLFAALVIGGLVLYGVSRQPQQPPAAPPQPNPTGVYCTMEAKLCPDGKTYVGRQGPKCEFAPCPETSEAPALKTYTNAKYGFTVSYPDTVTPTDDVQDMQLSGYIPVCDPDVAVACFPMGKAPYAGKNFENAAFAVHVRKALKTEASCESVVPDAGETADGNATIDGTAFRKFAMGDAAMGHQLAGENYRAFRGGTCYELATRIGTTTFENYEPGTIERFTDQDRADVERALEAMLTSFRFSGN
jgi:hypothetical protein